jgi:phosphoglycerate dehydrogenase-like enzyme
MSNPSGLATGGGSGNRPRILAARRVPEAVADRAREAFDAVIAEQDMDADAVIRATREYASEAIFSGPKVRLTAAGIAALPDAVRIIANPSAGYDHMDVAAARARGVIVTNTPDVPAGWGLLRHHARGLAQAVWHAGQPRQEAQRADTRHRRHGPHRPGGSQTGTRLRHADPVQ